MVINGLLDSVFKTPLSEFVPDIFVRWGEGDNSVLNFAGELGIVKE
jgi:hypothetical protein